MSDDRTNRPSRVRDRKRSVRSASKTAAHADGSSPRVVMETLGHSQVSLTLSTYSHVLPALQEDAASKMDAILTSSKA